MHRNYPINCLLIVCCFISFFAKAQNPIYGNEKPVTINGFTIDAMEPHLHTNDNALFFNSLNDGNATSLFYALRSNDTTFNLVGAVPVVNQTVMPRLDAVASIDTMDNFYWVSTRGYPTNFDNLHRVRFLQSGYTNFGRVHGDFYIYQPGYLIMDAAISYYGDKLVYCNAYFNNCGGLPCAASMGIAQKVNDSTFNKLANTSSIMAGINDTANYCVYAPNLSEDGLELFYTRFLKTGTDTEIMVATRSNTNAAFGTPSILVSAPGLAPEGPSISTDKSKMYFHKKSGGVYKIFVRYRMPATSLEENADHSSVSVFPNPASDLVTIHPKTAIDLVELRNVLGETVMRINHKGIENINLGGLSNGVYFLSCNGRCAGKIIVAHP